MIGDWREPTTGAIGLHRSPADHSEANNPLITTVGVKLGLIAHDDGLAVIRQYMDPGGAIRRYPGVGEWCSYDDHVAAFAVFPELRPLIGGYMKKNWYRMPDGNWIGHCVLLVALVSFSPLAVGPLLANLFEKKSETSGKQLIWLSLPVLSESFFMLPFVWLWKRVQSWRYPDGPRGIVFEWYTDPDHPFHDAAPTKF